MWSVAVLSRWIQAHFCVIPAKGKAKRRNGWRWRWKWKWKWKWKWNDELIYNCMEIYENVWKILETRRRNWNCRRSTHEAITETLTTPSERSWLIVNSTKFREIKIELFSQKLPNIQQNSEKFAFFNFCQNQQQLIISAIKFLTKILRLENGAKECIV